MMAFCDTSALLMKNLDELFETYGVLTVSDVTVRELEELKYKYREDPLRSYRVRKALHLIHENHILVYSNAIKLTTSFILRGLPKNNDSKIICHALDWSLYQKAIMKKSTTHPLNRVFITADLAQSILVEKLCEKHKRFNGLTVCWLEVTENKEENKINYLGFSESDCYSNHFEAAISHVNQNDMVKYVNEYFKMGLVDTDEIRIYKRISPTELVPIEYKDVRSRFMGNISPRNDEQKMLFDLLQNDKIKVKLALGNFGTGKSFVMLAHAIDMVQRGKFDHIVFIRNNIQLKDTRELGSLPGTELEKIFPFLMPIADHVGGVEGLENLIDTGIIEPVHLGFLRGRDLQRTIIFCDECENLTKQHVQLILGRCSEGSQVWFAGDLKQTDNIVFEKNSGIIAMMRCLVGNKLFGMVKLIKSERGEVAQLADLMD